MITAGRHPALFLPSVWAQLPDPAEFLDHLQAEAGPPPGGWPSAMRSWRFTTDKVTRDADGQPRRGRAPRGVRYGPDMVDVVVQLPDGTERPFDHADYTVLHGGVLHVSSSHGPTVLFGPSGWLRLEERRDEG